MFLSKYMLLHVRPFPVVIVVNVIIEVQLSNSKNTKSYFFHVVNSIT